jgi:CPA2 family monovalent cation:H+ antiporter-2
MGLDIHTLLAHPVAVLAAASGLILVKLLVIAPLARAFGLPWAHSVQSGLLLGPGGEFGFVILTVGGSEALLTQSEVGFVLIVAALTMAMIPLLSKSGQLLAPPLVTKTPLDPSLSLPTIQDVAPRVIVAGFGRVGQTVAAMLEVHSVPYVAIDSDPDLVARQRGRGRPIYYGDMTGVELLRRLRLETARALVSQLTTRMQLIDSSSVRGQSGRSCLLSHAPAMLSTQPSCIRVGPRMRCRRRLKPACSCPKRFWSISG